MQPSHKVTYRDDGSSGGCEMELTVFLPGVTSASECGVALERWRGSGPPPVSSASSSSSSSFPSGGSDDDAVVSVGAWCVVVEAAAAGLRLAVALPSDAAAVRDAGTERELDSIVVKFSRKHQRLTVRAAILHQPRTPVAAPASAPTRPPPSPPLVAVSPSTTSATSVTSAPSEAERRLRERAVETWLQRWLRAGGAACHSEDGADGDTPEAAAWRDRYVEARLADARESITRVLGKVGVETAREAARNDGGGEGGDGVGVGVGDGDGLSKPGKREAGMRRERKKKDAPDAKDAAGVRALLAAQAVQRSMVAVTTATEEEEGASGGGRTAVTAVGLEGRSVVTGTVTGAGTGAGTGTGQRPRRLRRRRVMAGRRNGEEKTAGLAGEALSAEEVAAITGIGIGTATAAATATATANGVGTVPVAMFRVAWNAPSAPDPHLVLTPAAAAAAAASSNNRRRRCAADESTSSDASNGSKSGGGGGGGGGLYPRLRWSDLRLYAEQHPQLARRPRRRVVLDGFATPAECRAACGAAIVAMEGLPRRDGETTLAADDWDVLREWAGADAAALAARLCARTRRAVAAEFAEPRALFLAGSLLTRLQPRRGGGGGGGGGESGTAANADKDDDDDDDDYDDDDDDDYDSLAAHVDAANIASYDYSAVLYLNAAGHSFEGGEFVFRDGAAPTTAATAVEARKEEADENGGGDGDGDDASVGEDQVVEPARGRLLLFTSGCENLHNVMPVKPRGAGKRATESETFTPGKKQAEEKAEGAPPAAARFVLAMWFTLAQDKGQDIPSDVSLARAPSSSPTSAAAAAAGASTPAAAAAVGGGGGGGSGGVSELERLLEEKVASVKSSLGMTDEQLARLLAKLPPM